MNRISLLALVMLCIALVFAAAPSPVLAEDPQATLEGHQVEEGNGTVNTNAASAEKTVASLEALIAEYEKLIAKVEDQLKQAEGTVNIAAGKETTGTVSVVTRLNVRTGPWGKIIDKLYDGNQVQIVAKEGDWFKIRHGDGYAYVHSNYVNAPGYASTQTADSSSQPSSSDSQSSSPGTSGGKPSSSKDSQKPSTSSEPPKAEVSGNRIYVNVPKYTQFEKANGQYQNSWCGPTSLRMVYEYYGRTETTKSIAGRIYVKGSGTSASSICSDAKKHGFPGTVLKESANIDYLKARIKEGKPVICNVDVNWKNGHHMVVVGFEGNKVIVNDPGRSVVRREFDVSWFVAQWKGRNCRCVVVQK